MAWNEPGNSNNDDKDKKQDPWTTPPKPKDDNKNNGNNGSPPDLDEVFRKLKASLNKLFGDKTPSSPTPPNKEKHPSDFSISLLPIALIIIIIIGGFWLSKAIYTVDQQEEAVILRFGKVYETVGPGLHIYFPPIDVKYQVNVTAERSYNKQGQMLTKDENIVEIPLTVQYRINDLQKFILKNNDPEKSLENATDSALRQIAGSTTMDEILTSGRSQMSAQIQNTLEDMLDKYETGIKVTQVNIQSATAPSDVQRAFDDVIRAREDQQRAKNKAETYKNGIIPTARGQASRLIKEAQGYKEAIIDKAKGEAARFDLLLTAYQQAPEVTKERLYIETIQAVLTKTTKVLISTTDGKNQLLYLPLDKMIHDNAPKLQAIPINNIDPMTPQAPPLQNTAPIDLRVRGSR